MNEALATESGNRYLPLGGLRGAKSHMPSLPPGNMFHVAEVARLAKVSASTIYRWMAERRFHAVRLSPGTIRIPRHRVEELIATLNRRRPPAPIQESERGMKGGGKTMYERLNPWKKLPAARPLPRNAGATAGGAAPAAPPGGRISDPEHGRMGRIVIDVETQRLIGEAPLRDLGVACLGYYQIDDELIGVTDPEAGTWQLTRHAIATSRLVIGWNVADFDLVVLNLSVLDSRVCDLMKLIELAGGGRCSLDSVAKFTLGGGKLGHGADAPRLYAQKRFCELHTYCLRDVRLTLDLYNHARLTGHLAIPPDGRFVNIQVPG